MKSPTLIRQVRLQPALVLTALAGAVSCLGAAEIPPPPLFPGITPVCSCESLTNVAIANTIIDSAALDPANGWCRVTAIVKHPPSRGRGTHQQWLRMAETDNPGKP